MTEGRRPKAVAAAAGDAVHGSELSASLGFAAKASKVAQPENYETALRTFRDHTDIFVSFTWTTEGRLSAAIRLHMGSTFACSAGN